MNSLRIIGLAVLLASIAHADPRPADTLAARTTEPELHAHLAFGPEYSNYTHEVNRLIDDPIGASVEMGFGSRTTRLLLRAGMVTSRAKRTESLSGDTIFQGNKINFARWSAALSHQTFLTNTVYMGFLYGLEWGSLGRPQNQADRQPDISVPVTSGALIGCYVGQNVVTIPRILMNLGYRVEYTYSTLDYRVYNHALGYGRHGLALKAYIGD